MPAQSSVNVLLQETPLQTAKISVFVFEDDMPLNGENDAGGGVDVLATERAGPRRLRDHDCSMRRAAPVTPPARSPTTCSTCRCRTAWPARSILPRQLRCVPDLAADRTDGTRRHDRHLPEVRVRRQDAVAARRPGGHREPHARALRSPGHAGRRPHRRAARNGCRPTRWTAESRTTRSSRSAARPTSRSSVRRASTSSIGFANPKIINARLAPECAAAKATDPGN